MVSPTKKGSHPAAPVIPRLGLVYTTARAVTRERDFTAETRRTAEISAENAKRFQIGATEL
jgi:hypothetical protein